MYGFTIMFDPLTMSVYSNVWESNKAHVSKGLNIPVEVMSAGIICLYH